MPGSFLSHTLYGVHLDTCKMEVVLSCASELEIVPVDMVCALCVKRVREESSRKPTNSQWIFSSLEAPWLDSSACARLVDLEKH